MPNYQEVPNIITGKDLDYLSDMFELIKKACGMFDTNLKIIISILGREHE